SQRLGVQIGSLVVARGVVSIDGEPNRSVRYGELVGDKAFDIKFTGTAPRKPPSEYKLVGTRVPRVDMPAKVAGTYTHMQHMRVDGMLHGRVVRPRGQRAYGTRAAPLAVDEASIKDIPEARIVRRGDFLSVVAESEWGAIRAAQQLEVRWQETPALPDMAKLPDVLRSTKSSDTVVVNIGDPETAFGKAVHVSSATYFSPYQPHAAFGPNCAIADVTPDRALVMCSTQDIYASRK